MSEELFKARKAVAETLYEIRKDSYGIYGSMEIEILDRLEYYFKNHITTFGLRYT